jgi:hypothetical protein
MKTPPAQRAPGMSLHLHMTTRYDLRPSQEMTFRISRLNDARESSLLTLQTPKPEIAPLDEIDGYEPPSIQWSWLYWDFGNQEFEMQ